MAKRAGPYYDAKAKGHSWQTRAAAEVLKQKSDAFQPITGVELISALRGHRSADDYWPQWEISKDDPSDIGTVFAPAARLDTSMIDDRRGEKKAKPKPSRQIRLTRPKVKLKPTRPVNQGRHDEATTKPSKQSAFAGDGRLERPAPKATHKLGAAGSSAARPKKTKPITNQGRHDG